MFRPVCLRLVNLFLLPFQGSESEPGPASSRFVSWCDDNRLHLNVSRTKDMIINFRRSSASRQEGESTVTMSRLWIRTNIWAVFDCELRFDVNPESGPERPLDDPSDEGTELVMSVRLF